MAKSNRFLRRAWADWVPHRRVYLLRGLFGGPLSVGVGLWFSSRHAISRSRVALIAGLIGAVGGPIIVSITTFLWCLVGAPLKLLNEREDELRILEVLDGGPGKNQAAVALGRLGGKKGGLARAAKLIPARRKAIARKAAKVRWSVQGKWGDCSAPIVMSVTLLLRIIT